MTAKRGKAVARSARSLSGEAVYNAILAVDAEPFRALLTEMIGGRPTPEAIAEWARTNPDRWATAIGIFARLAGYDFKGTVAHEHTHRHLHLHQMSDAELVAELSRLRADEVGVSDGDVEVAAAAADPLGPSGEADAVGEADVTPPEAEEGYVRDDVLSDVGVVPDVGAEVPGDGLW